MRFCAILPVKHSVKKEPFSASNFVLLWSIHASWGKTGREKKAKPKTKQINHNSLSTDWHSSKANMRKKVNYWIAYSSTQQSLSDTLILTRMEVSNAWWSAKICMGTSYAFSLSVFPGVKSSVHLYAQKPVLMDMLAKWGARNFHVENQEKNACHS